VRFLSLSLLLLLPKLVFAAPLPAFQGTVTQTQNGVTARAKIAWQPPSTLVVEVERDDSSLTAAQTVLAHGDETLIYEPASKRTRRTAFNVATNWWRSSNLSAGGPANYLFAGTPSPTDTSDGRYLNRDDVLFGGGGRDAYYAAVKTPARLYPARTTVTPVSRIEKNEAGKTLLDAKITLGADGLPQTAQVSAEGLNATFSYDLKPTAAALTPPEIPVAIVEDDRVLAPSAYTGGDASSLFNQGAALALDENFPAAFAAFTAASRSTPTASAPIIAMYELAMLIRDDALAAGALAKMETLGLDPTETLPRRARVALLRRDYEGALTALKSAALAAPQNLELRLLEAEALRSRLDFDGARALYLGILAEKTPQVVAQVTAAQTLANMAMPDEFPALLTAVPGTTQAQKLARSLIQLRDGQAAETNEFSSDEMEIALALGYESAARDEEAQKAWQTLETRGSDLTKTRARAHMMTLAARRGDVSASIGYWRAWNATLVTTPDRDAARAAFFDAWQKAFRSETLQSALANRAAATGATEDDMRLFVAYLELYGTSDDLKVALDNGSARFPTSPFWLGRIAERKVVEANETRGNDAGLARREQLYNEAMRLLDRAIAAAPDEIFYRFQKALAATQRGAKTGGVIDPGLASKNRALAKKETAQLIADFPGDPDVLVSAALQNLAFEGDSGAQEAIKLATLALDSRPGDGDRHTLIWAARQALATSYRRLKQNDLAAAQWEILLQGARDPGEQSALAMGYTSLLESTGDTEGVAQLLTRIAGQNWGYSGSRASLDALAQRVAASPIGAVVVKSLAASSEGASALALATLAQKQLEIARRMLELPEAPPATDANLDRANRDLGMALGKLRVVAAGPDRLIAARAAAFLAEGANLAGEERFKLLRSALDTEPRDAALRFALVGALSGEEGKKERDIAAKILDFRPETRRQLSSATRNGGDLPLAQKLGEEAFNSAARAPEVTTNTFQRLAFSLARTAFNNNQTSRAIELYNGLSLPQWNPIDRAAALLALSRNYKEQGKDDEVAKINPRITALGITQAEASGAITFVDDVEN
jgi:hypothetical protein